MKKKELMAGAAVCMSHAVSEALEAGGTLEEACRFMLCALRDWDESGMKFGNWWYACGGNPDDVGPTFERYKRELETWKERG